MKLNTFFRYNSRGVKALTVKKIDFFLHCPLCCFHIKKQCLNRDVKCGIYSGREVYRIQTENVVSEANSVIAVQRLVDLSA